MKFLSTITTCTVALVTSMGILTTNTVAQEQEDIQIEIVNQDGEKVKTSEIELATPGKTSIGAKGGVSIFSDSGKITIIDSDGTKREIDVAGAKSIIVNQSARSSNVNGEEKKEFYGKAIIVGPDGTRQEIELAPGQHQGQMQLFHFDGLNPGAGWDQVRAGQAKNSYMIGVNCSPVSELLSKQLRLESNTGLVIDAVSKDSPAQAAGIEKHDILMFADDRQLSTIADLTDVVQAAGKDESKISLRLMRAGKEIGIEVTPTERPANSFGVFEMQDGSLPPNVDFQFRRMTPGVIMGPDMLGGNQQIEEQMKAVREQMEQLRQEMRENFEKNK